MSDAVETDWALSQAAITLANHYPDKRPEDLEEMARRAMSALVARGLVQLYWLGGRQAGESEAARVKGDFGITGDREVVMPTYGDILRADAPAILADDANWAPLRGRDGRPWLETPRVAFMATETGKRAYFGSQEAEDAPTTS